MQDFRVLFLASSMYVILDVFCKIGWGFQTIISRLLQLLHFLFTSMSSMLVLSFHDSIVDVVENDITF